MNATQYQSLDAPFPDLVGEPPKDLMEMLVEAYNRPDPRPYLFQLGQIVRLKKGRSNDGQTPSYWDGAVVEIFGRYTTGLHKDHWYKVYLPSQHVTCEFSEDEIDLRYSRKEKP
jgi:hypothetical protein